MASDQERSDDNLYTSSLSRRQALGAMAAGAGSLALGIDLGLTDGIAQAKESVFYGAWPYNLPPAGHNNSYILDGTGLFMGIYHDLMEMPLAMYYWHDKKWLWLMATSGKYDGDNYVVKLRKGARWADGNPVTSQDLVNTWTIWRMLGNTLFDYVDTITAPDDHTVVFHMKVPSNVVERYVLHQTSGAGSVASPRPSVIWGGFAKRLRDLMARGKTLDSPEVKALRAELVRFRPKAIISSGPYQLDYNSITQGQATLVHNPTSWAANRAKFDKIVLWNGETATVTPLVLAGQVDYATHGFPLATDRAFVRKGLTVLRPPCYYGFGILPNYKRVPAMQNKVARQALMYMIDRKQMGPIVEGPGGFPNKHAAGFVDALIPAWLDNATVAKLNTYPHDPDKGVSMLKSIGWKKGSDGIWVTPDGQKATWEVLAEDQYVDILALATNFAAQLSPYGFNLKARTVAFTQGTTVRYSGKFDFTSYIWGSADPHPHFSYVEDCLAFIPPRSSGPGSGFNVVQKTKDFGTVNLRKIIDDSALGFNVKKQHELIGKMALIYNDLVPWLPFVERYGGNPTQPPGVHRVAGWPKPSDPIYLNTPYSDSFVVMMILTGQLHPA